MRLIGPRRNASRGEGGFILITVIWIAGFVSLAATVFAFSTRTHVRITANLASSAQAEAYADAGIMLALRQLIASRSVGPAQTPTAQLAVAQTCHLEDGGVLHIEARDEAGFVNLNGAGLPLLTALLAGLEVEPSRAVRLAAAILDYRDRDSDLTAGGAEAAEYQAAGLAFGPANAPFATTDEVTSVLGMDGALAERLQPFLSVDSHQAGVDFSAASEALKEVLLAGLSATRNGFGATSAIDPRYGVPQAVIAISYRQYFRLRATYRGVSGQTFVRTSVVDLGRRSGDGYAHLSWQRAAAPPSDAVIQKASSPC